MYEDTLVNAVGAGMYAVSVVVSLIVGIIGLVAMWKLYVKAGKPGWGVIVPFYCQYCMFDIAFGNGWIFLLCLIPCVNFVVMIIFCLKMAKAFGKSTAFGLGLIFLYPIFIMILGFGDAVYVGPDKN